MQAAGDAGVQPTSIDGSQPGSRESLMHDLRTSDGRVIRGVRGDGNQEISLDDGQIVIHNRGKIEIYRENNGGVDYRNEGQSQYDLRQHIPYARTQGQEWRNRFASNGDDYGLDDADAEVAAYHAAQNQSRINQRQFSPMTYPQTYGMPQRPGAYYGPQTWGPQPENGVAQTVDAFGRLLGAVAPIGLAALALHSGGGLLINPGYGGYQSGWNGGYQPNSWNGGYQQNAWNGGYQNGWGSSYQTAWNTPTYPPNPNTYGYQAAAWNPNASLNPNYSTAWNYQLALQQQQQQQFYPYPRQFAPPNPGYTNNAYNYQLASGWGSPQYTAQPYYNAG